MPQHTNTTHYLRYLDEISVKLNNLIDTFLDRVLFNDFQQRKIAAGEALTVLGILKSSIASSSRPPWVDELDNKLRWYAAHGNTQREVAVAVLKEIVAYQKTISRQKWEQIAESGVDEIDFDKIFREAFSTSGIPELFKNLISELEAILNSGEIDSIAAKQEIERLLEIIKKNGDKDYFSVHQTQRFVFRFAANFGLELLGRIPGVGDAVKAFRRTCDDMKQKTEVLDEEVNRKITEKTAQNVTLEDYHLRRPLRIEHKAESPAEGSKESTVG